MHNDASRYGMLSLVAREDICALVDTGSGLAEARGTIEGVKSNERSALLRHDGVFFMILRAIWDS